MYLKRLRLQITGLRGFTVRFGKCRQQFSINTATIRRSDLERYNRLKAFRRGFWSNMMFIIIWWICLRSVFGNSRIIEVLFLLVKNPLSAYAREDNRILWLELPSLLLVHFGLSMFGMLIWFSILSSAYFEAANAPG